MRWDDGAQLSPEPSASILRGPAHAVPALTLRGCQHHLYAANAIFTPPPLAHESHECLQCTACRSLFCDAYATQQTLQQHSSTPARHHCSHSRTPGLTPTLVRPPTQQTRPALKRHNTTTLQPSNTATPPQHSNTPTVQHSNATTVHNTPTHNTPTTTHSRTHSLTRSTPPKKVSRSKRISAALRVRDLGILLFLTWSSWSLVE